MYVATNTMRLTERVAAYVRYVSRTFNCLYESHMAFE
jgi:hypothetical protein